MRAVGPVLTVALMLAPVPGHAADDARRAVVSFLDRIFGATVTDLTIRQQLTIYALCREG